MRIPTIVKIFLKAILLPIITVFALSKLNLFEYMAFVPTEYQYEIGLTVYLVLFETIYGFGEKYIDLKNAKITCTFFITAADKEFKNIPTVICNEDVTSIGCHIELYGNLKRLRKCQLSIALPHWVTSQTSNSDTVLNYTDNRLYWSFERLLPEEGRENQTANYQKKIPFIRNISDNNLSVQLEPKMNNVWGVTFETNSFKIQNGV